MHLTGPLYSKVLDKIKTAQTTGTTTRITLIQQRICLAKVARVEVCPPRLYHVGLLAEDNEMRRIFEHGPVKYDHARDVFEDDIIIPLPSVIQTVQDIEAFEKSLPSKYVIGIRDCRHHVLDLLHFLY